MNQQHCSFCEEPKPSFDAKEAKHFSFAIREAEERPSTKNGESTLRFLHSVFHPGQSMTPVGRSNIISLVTNVRQDGLSYFQEEVAGLVFRDSRVTSNRFEVEPYPPQNSSKNSVQNHPIIKLFGTIPLGSTFFDWGG